MELMGLFLFTQLYRLNHPAGIFSSINIFISATLTYFSAQSRFSARTTIFSDPAGIFSSINIFISATLTYFSAHNQVQRASHELQRSAPDLQRTQHFHSRSPHSLQRSLPFPP